MSMLLNTKTLEKEEEERKQKKKKNNVEYQNTVNLVCWSLSGQVSV